MRVNRMSAINLIFSILVVFTISLAVGFKIAGTHSKTFNPVFVEDGNKSSNLQK